jgi:iron(III) transport system permease protein
MSVIDAARVMVGARPRLGARGFDLRRWILPVAVAAALLWLILPPLIFIVQTSLTTNAGDAFTLAHYAAVFASLHGTLTLFGNSIVFAVGSDVLAIALGTLLAWLTERTDAPFKGLAYIGAFLSFAVPPIVKVIGWILLFGPKAGFINVWLSQLIHIPRGTFDVFSMGGMIAIEGLLWTPIVFLLMTVPFRSLDPSLEEAASTSGAGAMQAFRRVTLPLALPSVLAVLLLTAARSISSFEVPALIGIPAGVQIFTTRIYLLTTQGLIPHYGDSSAYGVILMIIVAMALYPYYLATRQTQKFATITGKGFRPRLFHLGRWRMVGAALMLLLPLLVVLPTLALLWASVLPYVQQPTIKALHAVTLRNYPHAFADPHIIEAATNSVIVGLASATGAMFLTMLTAWIVVRGRSRARWLLDQLTTVPLMIPGIVLGIAILRTYLTLPVPLYGTVWILVVAYVTASLPFSMRFCYSGVLTIARELEESAQVSGASWWTTMRKIVLPLMMPAMFAGWIAIFMVTFRELTVSLLLVTPSSQVIPVTIWDLWENGSVTELSAFTVVLSVALIALGLLLRRLSQRYGYRIA